MTNNIYSPQTGEHILTNDPAPWMGRARTDAPAYDPATQGCFWRNDAWEVVDVTPAKPTPEETEALRQAAYEKESDPLFFKWQRGEIEQQVWLDKVAEIKARYPE